MCKASEEIQKLWERNTCDFVAIFHPTSDKARLELYMERSFDGYEIWLPRQDQLQKMLSKTSTLGYFISGLHEFFDPESLCPDADGECPPCNKCSSAGKERRTMYETMEQWWLAFVMSELYTKKWNGTEWVYDSSWRVPDHAEDAQGRVTK